MFIGNKYHAADVSLLARLGVTAVLNCAPSGIRNLPIDAYRENGIEYAFTNVTQDAEMYPILHDRKAVCSEHLRVAKACYTKVKRAGGKAFFFCVAGQNRSATLALAVQIIVDHTPLDELLREASAVRPFILENVGFQKQLIEVDAQCNGSAARDPKRARLSEAATPQLIAVAHCDSGSSDRADSATGGSERRGSGSQQTPAGSVPAGSVMVELLVPGMCTFNVIIPKEASVEHVKGAMRRRVDEHLASSWLVFTTFFLGPEFSLLLEEEGVEHSTQLQRLHATFGLELLGDPEAARCAVRWTSACRFELVVFSTMPSLEADELDLHLHEPFVFRHEERVGAPGTLLEESIIEHHPRAWDFNTGAAHRSEEPLVFSYSADPRDKRDFMNISTAAHGERLQFNAPGEGGILGMGNNAIVHRVQLGQLLRRESMESEAAELHVWDAAVKRPFSLPKMLAALTNKAEAGVAKRLRMAGALNQQGRLLYFHGLGIVLSSNNNNNEEFKFEAVLLSQFQADFSSYTLKAFMDDFTAVASRLPEGGARERVERLQATFSLIQVKVLLVSLLNGFRDLTLMGVQAFDFNHLNNVLISRDYRKARLIDIDGASKGSIQFPSRYISGADPPSSGADEVHDTQLHKPALDIDLSTLLPLVVQQLMLGKGRGKPHVDETVSKVRRAKGDDAAKAVLRATIVDHFFPILREPPPADAEDSRAASEVGAPPPAPRTSDDAADKQRRAHAEKHVCKVVEWLHAVILRRSPWTTWTNDVYDALRCVDHLPIG